jgi:hypothetical protein
MKKNILRAALVGIVSSVTGLFAMVAAPQTAAAAFCVSYVCNHNGVCQIYACPPSSTPSCPGGILCVENKAYCPSDCH